MPLTFGNKVENNGATSAGKLSAEEFNSVVQQINTNEKSIQDLDAKAVKSLKLNGKVYNPDNEGLVEAVINVGTTMNVARKKANIVAKLGSQIFIEYSFMSVSSLGSTGKGEATYYFDNENNQPLATVEVEQSTAVDDYSVKFDVTDFITGVGSYTFIAVIKDSQGNQSSIKFTVETIEFTLKNLLSQGQFFTAGALIPYRYGIEGSGSNEKTIYFYVTRRATGEKVLAYTSKVVGSDTANLGQTLTPSDIPLVWTHGAYTLSVYATISDGEDIIYSNTINIDLIITETGNNTPIVSLLNSWEAGFNKTAKVYETISTSIAVYVPGAESTTVELKANGETVSTIKLDNLIAYTWNYTIEKEYDELVLAAQCGSGYADLPPLSVHSKLVDVEETAIGLALKLSSRGRSNDDADRDVWESQNDLYGNYKAIFSGFNWSSNGWVDAADGARALHITGGAKVEIPFKVFGVDANSIIQSTGRTIEFEFMANNATDYDNDNHIISCFADGIGFYVTPKYIYFQNSSGSASSLSTHFKEGERVRVGFLFQSLVEGGGMFLYVNGKQSGYYTYEQSHSFRQSSPVNIIIDSTKCDIDIYRIMVYNSALTKNQMVNNLTTGKDSIEEMLTVFNRNNIFYNGQLSATLLQDQLPVMIMTAKGLREWMTQEKIDKKMSIKVDITYIDKADPRKSFTCKGAKLSFQGTSSMGYPVRNFKIKFKGATLLGDISFVIKEKAKYRLRDNSFAVGTFCLKADFAESSGTHNTAAARLINEVLTTATSGTSHPYLTPPQANNASGNDVRTTVDGFPIVLFSRETETGEATFVGKYNFNNDKSTQEVFGFEGIEGFNSNLTNRTEILPEADDYRTATGDINSKSTINPCECWEFKSNDVDLCKFKFNTEDDLTRDALKTAFESRYPEEYAAPSDTEEATKYEDTTWGHHELKKVLAWVHSTDTKLATGNKLSSSAYYNGITYLYDTAEYRLAKFKAEVSEHFNLNNLLSYFVLTDLLGAVDQRAKNQMMASWGNEGSGDFKWYFIFYDNDTILGINNTGKIAHDYDLVSDTVGGYSGKDSVLWLNLEACFYNELCDCWGNLISAVSGNVSLLSYENLIAEFNTRQCDKWAESVFNEDSNYKYVYQGGAANKDSDYYTVLQGSRAEHRKYWIDNRLQWIHGKYKSKNFLAEGTGWRCNKVAGVNADEPLKLTINGARKQYYGYIIGNTTNEVFLLESDQSKVCEYTGGWDYTNLNLAGEAYITDFGDISHQLPSDIKLSKMTRLKRLVLSSEQFKNDKLLNLSLINKPFLEYLDISYATKLSAITDYSACYRLKRFLAYHSGLRETPFADGADLEYAELPSKTYNEDGSIDTQGTSVVILKNLKYLTFDNFKMQDDDYSSITSIHIENCPSFQPMQLFNKVCRNKGFNKLIILDVNETVTYNDPFFANLVDIAKNEQIPSSDNRVTGVINTDAISNLHLGVLETKYPGLKIKYQSIVSSSNISIIADTNGTLYEGQYLQLYANVSGDPNYTEIEWSIIEGNNYASIDNSGVIKAIEQLHNKSFKEKVIVRAVLKDSKYVYSDFELNIEGISATEGTIDGDTWVSSQDGTVMPIISNNNPSLNPLCTKRITGVQWEKNMDDPNYSLYEIDFNTGVITFNAVKAFANKPTQKNAEFTIQICAKCNVFESTININKTIYIDYPMIGDYVYSNGGHSSKFYRHEVSEGEFSLIGICYYVSKDRLDRRMVATKNAVTQSENGLATCKWGFGGYITEEKAYYGYDIPAIINKTIGSINPVGENKWGTDWQSFYNGDPESQQNKVKSVAIGDMEGIANTDAIIAEREFNGFTNLDSYDDIANEEQEYPAAAFCRLYGDNSWNIGKVGEWWLPAAGELVLIWMNLKWDDENLHPNEIAHSLALLPGSVWAPFSGGYHWSSSELSLAIAVTVSFASGNITNYYKYGMYYVRAVSAF